MYIGKLDYVDILSFVNMYLIPELLDRGVIIGDMSQFKVLEISDDRILFILGHKTFVCNEYRCYAKGVSADLFVDYSWIKFMYNKFGNEYICELKKKENNSLSKI